jgi:hypothetical protein
MAAEWWLIDEPTQEAIASQIDAAADSVIRHFDLHANENSLTAALGHELLTTQVDFGDTTAGFTYRNFPEQSEERLTGADGGIVVTIRSPEETVKKAILFQAKRFPQDRPVKELSLSQEEAKRLRRQLDLMVPITGECVVLAQTREQIYALDGNSAHDLTLERLRHITDNCRLVTLGTFLGKWVARCARGELNADLVSRVENPQGFLRHQIGLEITTRQRPLLTDGGFGGAPLPASREVPRMRWRT